MSSKWIMAAVKAGWTAEIGIHRYEVTLMDYYALVDKDKLVGIAYKCIVVLVNA